jgi:hypothetical protein
VSLFLDDVEEIISILGEGADGPVTVADDEYIFESLNEFIGAER